MHLASHEARERNVQAARAKLAGGYHLLRVASWQDGVAVALGRSARSVRAIMSSHPRWIAREAGSGARQCMDELLPHRIAARRIARDHAGVAEAIRSGWADAGVCVRLASAEAGLQFLPLREEFYDLCFADASSDDPRVRALVRVLRSPEYRAQIAALPGYTADETGEPSGKT
jgi:molybdate-binding protein